MKAPTGGARSPAFAFLLGFGSAVLAASSWHIAAGGSVNVSRVLQHLLSGLALLLPRPAVLIVGLALALSALAAIGLFSWTRAQHARPAAESRTPQAQSHDAAITAELGRELAGVLKLLRGFLEANNRYDAALGRAQTGLGRASSQDQVWEIVKLLMAENDAIRTDARELRSQLVVSHEYIEELRASLTRAEEAALLDPLTGVGNRRRFDMDLEQAIEKAHKETAPLCLLLADMDNFKRINDRFGHPFGDEILKLFTALLKQTVKGRDRIARLGGEEFALILPNTLMGNAYHLAEQIREQLRKASWVSERTGQPTPPLTASIGIAQLRDGDTAAALVRRADAKLYEAKRGGRDQIAIEHSMAA